MVAPRAIRAKDADVSDHGGGIQPGRNCSATRRESVAGGLTSPIVGHKDLPVSQPTVKQPGVEPEARRITPLVLLTALLVGLVAVVIHGFRLSLAPDIFGDEGLYFLVARNFANGKGLIDDTGPFFWHPPLYPVLEAAYLIVKGTGDANFTSALLDARWVNVGFSAATAAFLVLLGNRLGGLRVGLLMAALFILDPFVARTNRRAMLETTTMFFMVAGLTLYYVWRHRLTALRVAGVGACLGLALLTKEIAAIAILLILADAVVFQRQILKPTIGIALVAGAFYAAYPVWALTAGNWDRFINFRFAALNRVLAVFIRAAGGQALPGTPGTGGVATRDPGFLVRLQSAVGDYGPSYVLLVVGAALTILLLLRYRSHPEARFVGMWSLISFVAVGVGVLDGFGDQFFYYVMIPSIVIVGCAVSLLARRRPSASAVADVRQPADRPATSQPLGLRRLGLLALTAGALALMLVVDAAIWAARFASSSDDSYARIAQYVELNIAPGSTIVVGGNAANFLLRPEYNIKFYRDPRSISNDRVKYFILSSKEVAQGYNRVTPAFYEFVTQHTTPLLVFAGDTYWTLGLYSWSGPYPF